jgi:hypothetical protein
MGKHHHPNASLLSGPYSLSLPRILKEHRLMCMYLTREPPGPAPSYPACQIGAEWAIAHEKPLSAADMHEACAGLSSLIFVSYQNPVAEKLCSLPLATPDRACSIASSNRNRYRSPLQHKYVTASGFFQKRPSLPNDLSFVVKDKEGLRRVATAWSGPQSTGCQDSPST